MKMSTKGLNNNNDSWLLVFDDPGAGKSVLSWYLSEFGSLDQVSVFSETGYEILSFFEDLENVNIVNKIDLAKYDKLMVGTSFPPKNYIKYLFSTLHSKNETSNKTWALVDRDNLVRERFFLDGSYFLPDNVTYTETLSDEDLDWFDRNGVRTTFVENPYLKYLSSLKAERMNSDRPNILKPRTYIIYAPEPISTFSLEDKFGFNELEILLDLCELLKSTTDIELVFMKHKNQIELNVPFEYKACFKSISSNEITGSDSIALLMNSLGVISFNSSILNEASAVGVPAIRALWLGCDSFVRKVTDINQTLFAYNLFDRGEFIPIVEYLVSRVEYER